MIAGFKERRRNLQTLGKLQLLLLRGFFAHAPAQLDGQLFDVDHREQLLDRFGAHLGHELRRMLTHQFAVALVGEQLALL